MTKCDFCTKSSPDGKCFWSLQAAREPDCLLAIDRMAMAFKNNSSRCEHDWVYVGLDEYRCNKCGKRILR